jgi:transposase
MTLLVFFHQSRFRCFKAFYLGYVCQHLRGAFPRLVSYSRFVEFVPSVLVLLSVYLRSLFGSQTGIAFADSTPLAVCHNRRISQHKVFRNTAKRGRTSVGWFYGFKLHLIINDKGELLNVTLTPGNCDDRKPLPDLAQGLVGKLFADRGYISQDLFTRLWRRGLHLITKIKKNMKPKLVPLFDAVLLRKRAVIESVNDQLKNISQIEHTRHRADTGFLWNFFAALIAYCHQPKKPSLNLNNNDLNAIA